METRNWLSLQVHDSLIADTPAALVPKVRAEMEAVMGQKWKELNGLKIGVDVKVSEHL